MKSLYSAILMAIASMVFCMSICEISFPDTFSWTEILIAQYPSIYRYGVHIGIAEVIVSSLLVFFAYKFDPSLSKKILESLFRIGLGGMFVFASLFKIQDPHNFAVLMAQYQFLPYNFVNPLALLMPIGELLVGVAIIVTPYTKENAFILLLFFIAFIVALSSALFRDLGITCGCFALEGAQDSAEAWTSLIRDVILLGPTIWLLTMKNRSIVSIWRNNKPLLKN